MDFSRPSGSLKGDAGDEPSRHCQCVGVATMCDRGSRAGPVVIDAELKSGALIDVFPEYQVTATEFNTAAWLVFPSRTYLPLKVKALLDYLKATNLVESTSC